MSRNIQIRKVVNLINHGLVAGLVGDLLNDALLKGLKDNENVGITWSAFIDRDILYVTAQKDVWITPNESILETGYVTIPVSDAYKLEPKNIEVCI